MALGGYGRYGSGLPRLRGQMVQALVERANFDSAEEGSLHENWYHLNLEQLPAEIRSIARIHHQDGETQQFLESCRKKSDSLFLQLYHNISTFFLALFMSKTTINGLLRRGSMFIFSHDHLSSLLDLNGSNKLHSCIDLGAGDGEVTSKLSEFVENVYATEMSTTMRWRLAEKGFTVLPVDDWHSKKYDLVSCLNLLDRCDDPIALLEQIRDSLTPRGRLLLAMVLPYKPYVEFKKSDHRPSVKLNITGTTFEAQLASLVTNILEPRGFKLLKATRLPYLCEGDLRRSYYVLSDAILLLERSEPTSPNQSSATKRTFDVNKDEL